MRSPRVGSEPQRGFGVGASLRELAGAAEQAAQGHMRLDLDRLPAAQSQRLPIAGGRVEGPVERLVEPAEPCVQFGRLRRERQGALEGLRGEARLAERLERLGHRPPRLGVVDVEPERRIGALKRLGRPAGGEQRAGETEESRRRGGIAADRRFEQADRLFEAPEPRQRLGEREMRRPRQTAALGGACRDLLPQARIRHVRPPRARALDGGPYPGLAPRRGASRRFSDNARWRRHTPWADDRGCAPPPPWGRRASCRRA